ncbi:MAG: hypothetical protein ACI89Z_000133 [Porticoccus sp.]|jgi:hypothetical protein
MKYDKAGQHKKPVVMKSNNGFAVGARCNIRLWLLGTGMWLTQKMQTALYKPAGLNGAPRYGQYTVALG